MKNLFKASVALLFGAACLTFASCSENGTDAPKLSEGDAFLQKVLKGDVENTINPTYASLADSCTQLLDALAAMQPGSITQGQVDKACEIFLHARASYEKSEAFLLGAASHFSIDPHIDSWPLDLTALHNLLSSGQAIATASNYDQSLIGFHGIEFILFRDGKNRSATELNTYDSWNRDGLDFTNVKGERELMFAKAVAEDLRNSVYQLECAWNENAPKAHFDVLDELGKAYVTDLGKSYGYSMINAGGVGSVYQSVKLAASAVLSGDNSAGGIADEVGNTKINNPFSGKDVSYIESPYSWNSLTDFQNNIHSVENVWFGGVPSKRNQAVSFHAYFQKYNKTVGERVEKAIQAAIVAIKDIPAPFVKNYQSPKCKVAINACQELNDALSEANDVIQKNTK